MTYEQLKQWREKKLKQYDEDRIIARAAIGKSFEVLTSLAEELAKLKDPLPSKIETPFGFFIFHKDINLN